MKNKAKDWTVQKKRVVPADVDKLHLHFQDEA